VPLFKNFRTSRPARRGHLVQEGTHCVILFGMPGTSPSMTVEIGGEKIRSHA
jgi:hypothetical protein